jgi:DNA-3-methyladenine glycosylase I
MSTTNTVIRCPWCGQDPLYQAYHDHEWGVPVYDEQRLFEFLILETAQAGLNWLTVLRKREGYRQAFAGFDAQRIAAFTAEDRQRLLMTSAIIRNRRKIEATITNARALLTLHERGLTLQNLLWESVEGVVQHNGWSRNDDIPAQTPVSKRLSQRLREQGFCFVGPVMCYALMQACGLVNDHLVTCYRYAELGGSLANPHHSS